MRAIVDSLGYDLDPSILIGGWATHLRVGGDISHDVDLIIADQGLRPTLRDRLDGYQENHRLSNSTKAAGSIDGVHVDAYFPYEPRLGNRLLLDVAELTKHTEPVRSANWLMLTLDAHIATKFAALLDRPDTEKGYKDARELVRLIDSGGTGDGVAAVMIAATAGEKSDIPDAIRDAFDLIPDRAGLNRNEKKHYRTLGREWVETAKLILAAETRPAGPGPQFR
ncbi:hypothetical protein [Curtobacterium sp. YC1]|uniref:hypothetical protein n=1 Tax=Curtobacterium sp. YC1 TaxID=2795488 RepID=UPI001E5EE8CE|nr:hypothetical protein [Curtobacterium sp. YC1]